ncbi:MAG: hypothetical protein KQH53_17760 [Desulfarculaceae bacterium]|nr:hypothetical protein [Desulfarculaceae bacterium]
MELHETIKVVRLLSEGVDPTTGEVLPEDHLINRPQIIRALHHVREILQNPALTSDRPANQGKPWSEVEDAELTQAFRRGDKIKDMAAAHQRSSGGIRSRLVKLGLIDPGK